MDNLENGASRRANEFQEMRERNEYRKALLTKLEEAKKSLDGLIDFYERSVLKEQRNTEFFSSLYTEILGIHDDLHEGFGKKLEESSPIVGDFNFLSIEGLKELEQKIDESESSMSNLETRLREAID